MDKVPSRAVSDALPFDPVKALDLDPSFKPPDASRKVYKFAEVPAGFFRVSRKLTMIVSVDSFQVAHVVGRHRRVDYDMWRRILAQLLLAGLDPPCAVAHNTDAMFVLCPELFGSGFCTANSEGYILHRYMEAVDRALAFV